MKRNTLLIGIVILILLSHTLLLAEPVTINDAEDAANFHLLVKEKSEEYSINDMFAFENTEGETLSYIANLTPFGFIALSADTDITPIITFSFKGNFPYDEDENNILYHMLKNDMELRLQAIADTTYPKILSNNQLWDVYLNGDSFYLERDFQQWPPEGSTITSGWIETTCSQNNPYNMLCPINPENGQRCVTGCSATSLSQIVNFHCGFWGGRQFNDSYNYTCHQHGGTSFIIDDDYEEFEFPSFEILNTNLNIMEDNYKNNISTELDIATLNFACGVLLEMNYTSGLSTAFATSSFFKDELHYKNAEEISINNTVFFNTLQSNMINSYPAELKIHDPAKVMIIP